VKTAASVTGLVTTDNPNYSPPARSDPGRLSAFPGSDSRTVSGSQRAAESGKAHRPRYNPRRILSVGVAGSGLRLACQPRRVSGPAAPTTHGDREDINMHIDRLGLTYAGGVLVLIALVLGGGLVAYQPSSFASTEELEAINMGFLLAPMLATVGITLLAIVFTSWEPGDLGRRHGPGGALNPAVSATTPTTETV